MKMLSKLCLLCDKPVEKSFNPDRKFCSTRHRQLYNYFTKEQKYVELVYVNCKHCKKLIAKTITNPRKYLATTVRLGTGTFILIRA